MFLRSMIRPAILAAICSVLPAQGWLNPSCSIQNLKGRWGFAELGWTVPMASGATAAASPVTVIGAFSVDSSGKMTGSGTTISATGISGTPIPAGEVLDFDFSGTVEITPECTGVLKYSIQLKGTPGPLPGQFIERFVYFPYKDELLSMSLQSPLSKPLWIGRYSRLGYVPAAVTWPTISQ